MQWFGDPRVMWVLVALGGALGSTLAWLVLRTPTPRRLLLGTAVVCGISGVLSAYPYWPAATAPLTVGVLGSAASMIAIGTAPPIWLDNHSVVRSTVAVAKQLAVYCAVGVASALFGYLAVRAGTTLYVKLR